MTVVAFPAYLVGQNYTSCLVRGVTLAANGTVTVDGTRGGDSGTTGRMDGFLIRRTRSLAQIQPVNSLLDNFVPLAIGFEAIVREIRQGTGYSFLDDVASNFDYAECLVTVTPRGGVTETWVESVYGVIEGTEADTDEGRNIITMSLRPIGVATFSGPP